jgi:HK97 family phage prohead protease
MRLERKSRPFVFEVKATDDGTFSGHGAVFHHIDAHGDIIAPGAFHKHLPFFLKRGFIGGLNHNWDSPIGAPTAAAEDAKGLAVAGKFSDTAHAREVRTLMKDGVIKELSIGYQATGVRWLETADDVAAYWSGAGYTPDDGDHAAAKYGARLLTEIKLVEVSPVAIASNDLATITSVKGQAGRDRLPFDAHLRAALAAVEEVVDRTCQLAAKRAESGRCLPPQRRTLLKQMRDAIDRALDACAEPIDPAAVLALQAEALALALEVELLAV